ncbi:hypothetical protein [Bythopirellula goksoeyrii]|uniref:hypothetical protein n=1 Tax=Bythopirellula goksoeyrii TaxID=1400387 RepID=UPI0011CE1643|nr:hypothetical protein [Bythopirellula goksoeyrii]
MTEFAATDNGGVVAGTDAEVATVDARRLPGTNRLAVWQPAVSDPKITTTNNQRYLLLHI